MTGSAPKALWTAYSAPPLVIPEIVFSLFPSTVPVHWVVPPNFAHKHPPVGANSDPSRERIILETVVKLIFPKKIK